jgi:hypothetical protein
VAPVSAAQINTAPEITHTFHAIDLLAKDISDDHHRRGFRRREPIEESQSHHTSSCTVWCRKEWIQIFIGGEVRWLSLAKSSAATKDTWRFAIGKA